MSDPQEPGTSGQQVATIIKAQAKESSSITKVPDPLHKNNWTIWCERMKRVLCLCGVEAYSEGKTQCPQSGKDVENWDFNDNYAQVLIINNITSTQMIHIGQSTMASAMWSSLEAVHKSKGHQTIIAIIRNLFHTTAEEDANISNHLNKLKTYWEHINAMDNEDFKISDPLFKVVISSSLPLSWDAFTELYVGGRKGVVETDQKKLMKSQQFISILKEEYLQ